jgi:mono/diheme cytochrome c family protein
MRERLAHLVLLLTLVVTVGLAYVFAIRHNPADSPPRRPSAPSHAGAVATPTEPTPEIARGPTLFAQHQCAACHAIAGRGNPRHPLDDTGTHWTKEELHHWVVGTGEVTSWLSDAVRRRKQRYESLPAEDLRELVDYLATLRSPAD